MKARTINALRKGAGNALRKGAGLAARAAFVGAVSFAASGCATQMSSMFGGGSNEVTGSIDGSMETRERSLAMAANDMSPAGPTTGGAGVCPRISVWRGDAQLTIYEIGRVGDNLAIRHRGEITKTARECEIGGGRVTVKYGVAGRVLLGPMGKPGVIKLPILVHVTDSSRKKIKTAKLSIKVKLKQGKPYGDFSTMRRISFPIPEGVPAKNYNIYVTFDRNAPGAG